MNRTSVRLSICLLLICCVLPLMAQNSASAESVVPAMVKFTGTMNDVNSKPLTGTVGVTFLLYKEQSGGAPLWMETQNVQADKNGRYSVMLGSATSHGIPAEAFAAGEARWLGVQPSGQTEQARVVLVSVPYALKALDAETLGGRPASAFMAAQPSGSKASPQGPQAEQANEIVCSSTTACKTGFVPLFSTNGGSAKVSDSLLSQSGSTVTINGSDNITGNETVAGTITAMTGDITGQLFVTAKTGNGAAIEASSASPVATVIYGGASSSTGATWGVEGEQFSSDPGASGVVGRAHNGGVGVTGLNDFATGVGVYGSGGTGVYGVGTSRGVEAQATTYSGIAGDFRGYTEPSNSCCSGGLAINAIGGNGNSIIGPDGGSGVNGVGGSGLGHAGAGGVFGGGLGSTGGNGIEAYAGSGYAGQFTGDVVIFGTLSASAKNFKIDHPLAPADKYLNHTSIESSEMLNLYTGNAILDADGSATVSLPAWFAALNQDFRYQLTAIGTPGPDLHIAEEIANNSFTIAGGHPGMKVSWQITGVRHDAYANAHRIQVEEEKPPQEQGHYLHPGLFGAGPELAIGHQVPPVPEKPAAPAETAHVSSLMSLPDRMK